MYNDRIRNNKEEDNSVEVLNQNTKPPKKYATDCIACQSGRTSNFKYVVRWEGGTAPENSF